MDSKNKEDYQSIVVQGTTFTIDSKYQFIRAIGHGAYGVVISVEDERGQTFAIKKVHNTFRDVDESKRILRELRLMRLMNHDNIISLVDMMKPQGRYDFEHIYLVMELMETDLHRIIHSKQHLSIEHVQFFAFQIISGVAHLHKHHIIHRDLKPSNILVNSNCDLKICDLGLSRFVSEDPDETKKRRKEEKKRRKKKKKKRGRETNEDYDSHNYDDDDLLQRTSFQDNSKSEEEDDDDEKAQSHRYRKPDLTEYVVTRWYRSPEVMLSCQQYSFPVDVWSVGCIVGELLLRRILFPGEHYMHQLSLICSVLGKPHEEDLSFITSSKALKFMREREDKPKVQATTLFQGTVGEESEDLMCLMNQLLEFDPRKRITIHEAKENSFFDELNEYEREEEQERKEKEQRSKEQEEKKEAQEVQEQFSFEYNPFLTIDDIKDLMYEEMRSYHPELPFRLPIDSQEKKKEANREMKQEGKEDKLTTLYPWHTKRTNETMGIYEEDSFSPESKEERLVLEEKKN